MAQWEIWQILFYISIWVLLWKQLILLSPDEFINIHSIIANTIFAFKWHLILCDKGNLIIIYIRLSPAKYISIRVSIINRAINRDEVSIITRYELINSFFSFIFSILITRFVSLNDVAYLNICVRIIDEAQDRQFHRISSSISIRRSIIVRVAGEKLRNFKRQRFVRK